MTQALLKKHRLIFGLIVMFFCTDGFAETTVPGTNFNDVKSRIRVIKEVFRRVPELLVQETIFGSPFMQPFNNLAGFFQQVPEQENPERFKIQVISYNFSIEEIPSAEAFFLVSIMNKKVDPKLVLIKGARIFLIRNKSNNGLDLALLLPFAEDGREVFFLQSFIKKSYSPEENRMLINMIGYATGKKRIMVGETLSSDLRQNRYVLVEPTFEYFGYRNTFVYAKEASSNDYNGISSNGIKKHKFSVKERALIAAKIFRGITDNSKRKSILCEMNVTMAQRVAATYLLDAEFDNPITAKKFRILNKAINFTIDDLSMFDLYTEARSLGIIYKEFRDEFPAEKWEKRFISIISKLVDQFYMEYPAFQSIDYKLSFLSALYKTNIIELNKIEIQKMKLIAKLSKIIAAFMFLPEEFCKTTLISLINYCPLAVLKAMSIAELPPYVWEIIQKFLFTHSAETIAAIRYQKNIPKNIFYLIEGLVRYSLKVRNYGLINSVFVLFETLIMENRIPVSFTNLIRELFDNPDVPVNITVNAEKLLNATRQDWCRDQTNKFFIQLNSSVNMPFNN